MENKQVNFLAEELETDREIHNEKMKVLSIQVLEVLEDMQYIIEKMYTEENSYLNSHINTAHVLTDIIMKLAHDEMHK